MSQSNRLYFFDSDKKNRWKKRYRKPPELLPFSVGLTGLSGALRVEAYLKQHQRDKEKEKAYKENKEVEFNEGFNKKSGLYGSLIELGKDKAAGQEGRKPLEKSQKQSFHYSPVGANSSYHIRSFDQLDGDDEDEDTQRFLFEENKFAAPNLLAQLGKLLDQINQRLLDERQEIRAVKGQLAEFANYYTEDDVQISLTLPDDLYNKLLWNYSEFSASAIYVKREWQTASYREQAILTQRLGNMADIQLDSEKKLEGEKPEKKDKDVKKKSNLSLDGKNSESNKLDVDPSGTIAGTESGSNYDPPAAIALRRESRQSTIASSRAKTRLEKFKYLQDKKNITPGLSASSLLKMRRNTGHVLAEGSVIGSHISEDDEKGYMDKYIASHLYSKDTGRYGAKPELEVKEATLTGSINFSMMSKLCDDRGWILHPSDSDDPERKTMLEWARARLLQALKQKEEQDNQAKLRGEDGELIMKYYGDTKRELTLKYKQGVSWAKRLKKIAEQEKKVKFLTTLPDGTSSVYYPSGRLAVCVAAAGLGLRTYYVHVYSDTVLPKMLGTFTPNGSACCYRTDGSIKFISTCKFGAVMEEDGSVSRKWTWPLGKLQCPLSVQLNSYINVRIVSHHSFTLNFSCQHEVWKCSVGMNNDATPINIDNCGPLLVEDIQYTSNTAVQAMKVKKKVEEAFARKERKRRKGQKQAQNVLTEEMIQQRQKDLDTKFPERKQIEMEVLLSDLDLHKIQRKVKNLVHEWMDHYRLAVGIKKPSQTNRRALAHSAKSLPGSLPSKRTSSTSQHRAPSAPPIPRALMKSMEMAAENAGIGRPQSSLEKHTHFAENMSVRLEVPIELRNQFALQEDKTQSFLSGYSSGLIPSMERLPFRCGVLQQHRPVTPRSGCAPALRSQILGEKDPQCRCDCRHMPYISDVEYDAFINFHVPKTQLLVVSVISSIYPEASPCDQMLDQVYYEKNKNRTVPCIQARNDPFRLVRYDMAIAAFNTFEEDPLLYRRHNAIPGMFLMYIGGKLMFADHIFNGYGNAKKDFLKQIMKSRKESLEGVSLPPDFRLSPSRGRPGPRAAWGGEIGGTPGYMAIPFSPTMSLYPQRAISTATTDSFHHDYSRTGTARSAANFISLGLSIDSPFSFTALPRSPDLSMSYAERRIRPHTVATKS